MSVARPSVSEPKTMGPLGFALAGTDEGVRPYTRDSLTMASWLVLANLRGLCRPSLGRGGGLFVNGLCLA